MIGFALLQAYRQSCKWNGLKKRCAVCLSFAAFLSNCSPAKCTKRSVTPITGSSSCSPIFISTEVPSFTVCCLLVDKEEIGSVGATGMKSRFFENAVAELMELTEGYSELKLRRCLSNSKMLSTDVSSAFDPT